MKLKNSNGFTLIELVIVIAILGILSAAAIPKFIDLSADAKKASLDSFAGAVRSTNSLVMGKAKIANVKNSNTVTQIPNTDLYVLNDHMSIKPEHLKNAMFFDDFMATDFNKTFLPSTYVYLGKKELTMEELGQKQCYIHLTRPSVQESGGPIVYGDLKIKRSYDGC
ncbi:type II secretion system protein [Psychromonas aquimarina]|uniref:type II secretion system protein n=1 Tax=Psychromonas aquimarina TaxID=444919 RepID=UPI000428EAB9|nr:type II secretion system protein [Psychromonas aquimarina]